MKAYVLLLGIALAAGKCKSDNGDPGTSSRKVPNEVTPECTDTIIIDKTKINLDWALSQASVICGYENDMVYIGLSKVKENAGNTAKAEWLREHRGEINFGASYRYIQRSHALPDNELPTVDRPDTKSPYLTYAEIKNKINSIAPADTNRFDNDRYNNYVKFVINSNRVDVELIQNFDPAQSCYSIPFLRSFGINNPTVINGNSKFYFKNTTVNNRPTVVFLPEGLTRFFDYTHIPKKNGGKKTDGDVFLNSK